RRGERRDAPRSEHRHILRTQPHGRPHLGGHHLRHRPGRGRRRAGSRDRRRPRRRQRRRRPTRARAVRTRPDPPGRRAAMSLPMALPPDSSHRLPLRRRFLGIVGFWSAVLLLRFQIKHSVALLAALKRRTRTPATVRQAAEAVAAARAAGAWFPGRAACLENSLAAALTAILMR